MSGARSGAVGAVVLAVFAAAAAFLVSRDDSDARRVVVPALESEQAAALAAQSGLPLQDFWARAKALGIAAAVHRPQSLDDAVRRGEILRFDRAELERWKAAGLLPPSTTLKPDTFWTKDARLFEQLLQALASQGVTPTTGTLAGFKVLQIPEGTRELSLRGYDPARVAAAEGLLPVYAGASGVPGGDASPLALEPASWRAGQPRGALLRRALGRPRRLLILRLEPSLGLEGNFTELRAALRELEARGAAPAGAPRPPETPDADAGRAASAVGAWLLGVLGPLFAARGGLLVLRRARRSVLARWPVASPVAQLAAGLLSTAAFATAAGLVVHALAARGAAPLPRRWAEAALVGPLVIAALTLYTIDLEAWAKALRRPATYAGLLKLGALALGASLLLAPRWLLHRAQFWDALSALGGGASWAWWWPWRWREILLGVPALIQALFLINWRLECPDCASLPVAPRNDPRHWFLVGLLAPIGIVVAVGQGAAPLALALPQTAWTLVFGGVLGTLGVAARVRAAHAAHAAEPPHAPAHGPAHSHAQPHAHPKGPAAH